MLAPPPPRPRIVAAGLALIALAGGCDFHRCPEPYHPPQLGLWLEQPTGTLAPQQPTPLGSVALEISPFALVSDLNRDGHADLVLGGHSREHCVFLGNGDGGWSSAKCREDAGI